MHPFSMRWSHTNGRPAHARHSLTDFLVLVRTVSVDLQEVSTILVRLQKMVAKRETLFVDHCEYAITVLHQSCQHLHEFSSFLDKTVALPLSAIPFSYQTSAKITYLEVQLQKLLQLFDEGRTVYQTSSKQVVRHEIVCVINEIVQYMESVIWQVNEMLDRVCIEERKG